MGTRHFCWYSNKPHTGGDGGTMQALEYLTSKWKRSMNYYLGSSYTGGKLY